MDVFGNNKKWNLARVKEVDKQKIFIKSKNSSNWNSYYHEENEEDNEETEEGYWSNIYI